MLATPVALALAACTQPPSPSTAGTRAPATEAQTANAPSDVQIFFDSGSASLTPAARQKLDQAARLYREGNPLVMFVAGHSDSQGEEYSNLVLSAERARIAKEALVERGIPASRLQLQALGTSLPTDPKVPPPENNRRVVITWR